MKIAGLDKNDIISCQGLYNHLTFLLLNYKPQEKHSAQALSSKAILTVKIEKVMQYERVPSIKKDSALYSTWKVYNPMV